MLSPGNTFPLGSFFFYFFARIAYTHRRTDGSTRTITCACERETARTRTNTKPAVKQHQTLPALPVSGPFSFFIGHEDTEGLRNVSGN